MIVDSFLYIRVGIIIRNKKKKQKYICCTYYILNLNAVTMVTLLVDYEKNCSEQKKIM